MTVKELIDFLYKCDWDYEVYIDYSSPLTTVEQYKVVTEPERNRVSLS